MKTIYRVLIASLTLILLSTAALRSEDKGGNNKAITPLLYRKADKDKMNQWVDSVFNQMTPDERIGQLFMIMASGDNTSANAKAIVNLVKNQKIGGILFSKGNPRDQAMLTNDAQAAAQIPLMISLDGEWGLSMRLSNTTVFPRNMMLGALKNDSLLYYYGVEVARQCRLMGIHVNFAPDVDVNSNPQNPVIGNRSYGEDPERVADLGIMYAKGLEAGGVMAVSKHFPGHGDTSTDSHKTLPIIEHDRDRLNDTELLPFKRYIKNGLSGIMVGHLDIPALEPQRLPSSLSTAIATDLLQTEFGFSGLIFTDGLQMKGVTGVSDYSAKAILAGNDILLGPISAVKEYENVKKAVADSIISQSMIDEKCRKILSYKYILGVNRTHKIDTEHLLTKLNTSNAEWINRQLNKSAMTLLRDEHKIIPLKNLEKRKIAAIAIGSEANNIFQKTLSLYNNVSCFSASDSDALRKMSDTLKSYNTVIVSVHGNRSRYDDAVYNICKDRESVIVFFGLPYRMTNYTASLRNTEGVLLAYEDTDLAQEYAAQAVFGGNNITGRIPVSVEGLYEKGDGMDRKKTRLSYNLPEETGIASYKLNEIDNIVAEGIKAKAFPGCQVLIARKGVVIYNRSFGTLAYDKKQSVNNTTLYDLASMSKATGTLPAIMKLYDEKLITLNEPISKYVAAFRNNDKSKITIREALFHESRLPAFIPYYMDAIDQASYTGKLFAYHKDTEHPVMVDSDTWGRNDYKFKSNLVSSIAMKGFLPITDSLYISEAYGDTIVKAIAESKLLSRKKYMYSCLNFMMLKEVAEKVSHSSLDQYLSKNFLAGLGADYTMYNPLRRFGKNSIAPTENDRFLRRALLQGYVHDEGASFFGGVSGNAGLFSNANDLAKLYQMLLNEGEYGGERYLSEKTCKVFTSMKSPISRRGLGFDKPDGEVNKYSPCSFSTPTSTYGHTGFTGTCFWIDLDNELIYIFLSNRVNDTRSHKELMTLKIRERIQEEIYKAIDKHTEE